MAVTLVEITIFLHVKSSETNIDVDEVAKEYNTHYLVSNTHFEQNITCPTISQTLPW